MKCSTCHHDREAHLRDRDGVHRNCSRAGCACRQFTGQDSPRDLECWRCLRPIASGRYNIDNEGPSHKEGECT